MLRSSNNSHKCFSKSNAFLNDAYRKYTSICDENSQTTDWIYNARVQLNFLFFSQHTFRSTFFHSFDFLLEANYSYALTLCAPHRNDDDAYAWREHISISVSVSFESAAIRCHRRRHCPRCCFQITIAPFRFLDFKSVSLLASIPLLVSTINQFHAIQRSYAMNDTESFSLFSVFQCENQMCSSIASLRSNSHFCLFTYQSTSPPFPVSLCLGGLEVGVFHPKFLLFTHFMIFRPIVISFFGFAWTSFSFFLLL